MRLIFFHGWMFKNISKFEIWDGKLFHITFKNKVDLWVKKVNSRHFWLIVRLIFPNFKRNMISYKFLNFPILNDFLIFNCLSWNKFLKKLTFRASDQTLIYATWRDPSLFFIRKIPLNLWNMKNSMILSQYIWKRIIFWLIHYYFLFYWNI